MMSESLDSRKFERKAMFDIPLPMRPVQHDVAAGSDDEEQPREEFKPNTMAFSLMTKRGNRQQVRIIMEPPLSAIASSYL